MKVMLQATELGIALTGAIKNEDMIGTHIENLGLEGS